jgi:hypothetical protein
MFDIHEQFNLRTIELYVIFDSIHSSTPQLTSPHIEPHQTPTYIEPYQAATYIEPEETSQRTSQIFQHWTCKTQDFTV